LGTAIIVWLHTTPACRNTDNPQNSRMQRDTIIGVRRGNMFSVFSIAFIVAIILLILLLYFRAIPLDQLINPISLIPISLFGIFFLLSFLKLMDRKPLIIIDDKGVSIRKSRLPFSTLEHINWNDIKGYTTKVEQFRYGATKFLVINRKSTGKKYYVDLRDLKTSDGDILTAFQMNLKKHQQFN
jgi:hypothetical protein